VSSHPLVDGNKRLGWLATYVFCARNGVELDPSDDDAYDFVVAIAAAEISEIAAMADRLKGFALRAE
jgi:death-on-curing protein